MEWGILAVDGSEGWIAAAVVGVFGVITAWLTARHGEKSDKIQQEQAEVASLIKGYTDQIAAYTGIVTGLQSEVKRIRDQYEVDRKFWETERITWKQERKEADLERSEMLFKVGKLEAELASLRKA